MVKRSIKKLVAFVLALAFVFQIISFAPYNKISADEDISVTSAEEPYPDYEDDYYDYEDPNYDERGFYLYGDELVGYYGEEENFVIPDDLGVTYVSLSYNSKVKSVTVPEGVESVYIYGLSNLETLNLPTTLNYITVEDCEVLKSLDLSKFDLSSACFGYCGKLETIKFNKAQTVSLYGLSSLKSVNIPSNTKYFDTSGTSFDGINIPANNVGGYSIKNGGLYHIEEAYDEDSLVTVLQAVDPGITTLNVKKGTTVIQNLNLSGSYYKLESVNLPDSVEQIAAYAFYGAENIKSLNIPKNVVSLGAYAFTDISVASLTIPASVEYIHGSCFAGYNGKVTVKSGSKNVRSYKDGIYLAEKQYWNNEKIVYKLIYYPSDKTTAEFLKDTYDIGEEVFMNSSVKELNLPEGLYWFELDLSNAMSLTSISVPASVRYIVPYSITSAPALIRLNIDKDNEDYVSVDDCLYDKQMTTLLATPSLKEEIRIPEGVLSLGYYAIRSSYIGNEYDDPDNYKAVEPTVYFPKSLENFDWFGFSFGKAYAYADTPIAGCLGLRNQDYRDWYPEDEIYNDLKLNYELLDSAKDLLDGIYVIDSVTVKKGKKTSDGGILYGVAMPDGVIKVQKLTAGNNSECQVTFSSSNKKIAKVNKYTGEIKGVKKGTCTINVKCVITDGKKNYTKKFKIKVKVKA